MNCKYSTIQFLDLCFSTRKLQFDISQISDYSVLIEKNILTKVNKQLVEVNVNSIVLNKIFLEYVENKLNRKIPQQIIEAFAFIDEFEKQAKAEHNYENILNAYSQLIDGLKSYVFYLFHSEKIVDVFDFFKKLPQKEKYHYDKHIFQTILQIDIAVENVYEILSLIKSDEYITQVPDFCYSLGKVKSNLATELFEYSLQKKDDNDFYILSNILRGLYEVDNKLSFSKTKTLLKINPTLSYFTLGRLKYTNKKHILESFKIAENANITDTDSLLQIPYIYKSLIENAHTPDKTKQKCFKKLEELFAIENEQLRNGIFMDLRLMNGYEKERYKILVNTILSKSWNHFTMINDYFRNFSNSDYFFELFVNMYYIYYKHNGLIFDVTIVRGNSWKIGDKEVSPLGEFEYSVALDLNMYKNPDLFDCTHHTFNSKF